MRGECKRHILARNAMGSVEGCSCGAVHLCLGPFTLRLEVPAFLALGELILQAHQGLTRVALARGEAGVSPWTRPIEEVP